MKFLKTVSIFLMLFITFNLIQATPTIVKAESNTQQSQITIQKTTEQPKKLQLSQTNKKIAGVCGGLAEYFNIDASVVRIGFVVFTFLGGSGILVYFVMWLIMK